jgi:hypothetical protein
MAVSPKTIEEWSRRGGTARPEWTKAVLEDALRYGRRLAGKDFEIFVQGSYANETDIRGSSDVDLVIQMRLPFEEDIDVLDQAARERFHKKYGETFYGWFEFREDVLATLRERFFVHEGNKCVDIKDWDSVPRIPADIVPAIEFRKYIAFPALDEEVYEEGVFFRDSHGTPIINFPKQHLAMGRSKDRQTGGRFKQVVRVFKNARKRCPGTSVEDAPSYFVECLVYNIDNDVFRRPLPEAYPACVRWLYKRRHRFAGLRCQNGMIDLFGRRGHQWDVEPAQQLITALNDQLVP